MHILNPIHTTSDLVTSVCFHSLSSLLKDLAAVVGEALFFSVSLHACAYLRFRYIT